MGASWTYVEATGCFAWSGRTGRAGRPVSYTGGQQTPAARIQWQRLYGPLPERVQLLGVCGRMDCVSPYHHVLRSPGSALAGRGFSGKAVARLAQTIEDLVSRSPDLLINWSGPLSALTLPKKAVEWLATALRADPMWVHAAYAKLVLGARPWETERGAPKDAEREALGSLNRLRSDLGLPPLEGT